MDIDPISKTFKILVQIILLNTALNNAFAIQCDPEKEYSVQNKTTGKTVMCLDCKDCKPGSELKIPCGSTIGIYESVGECQKCKNGYFSDESSVRPCQKCQNCLDHEVILGACNCTGHCEEGFVMTSQGLCERSQETTKDPALPSGENGKSGLSATEIVLIVLGVLLLVASALCCLYKCKKKNCQQKSYKGCGKNEKNISQVTNAPLLNKTDGKSVAKIIHQESTQNTGLPTSNGPHLLESSKGFVGTSQSSCV